jgi:hypothetical protein
MGYLNLNGANETEVNLRQLGGFTFNLIRISDTQNDNTLEYEITDEMHVETFNERCRKLNLPIPKELEIENEKLKEENSKLLDTIEEIRSEKSDWHQRFLDEKYRR